MFRAMRRSEERHEDTTIHRHEGKRTAIKALICVTRPKFKRLRISPMVRSEVPTPGTGIAPTFIHARRINPRVMKRVEV